MAEPRKVPDKTGFNLDYVYNIIGSDPPAGLKNCLNYHVDPQYFDPFHANWNGTTKVNNTLSCWKNFGWDAQLGTYTGTSDPGTASPVQITAIGGKKNERQFFIGLKTGRLIAYQLGSSAGSLERYTSYYELPDDNITGIHVVSQSLIFVTTFDEANDSETLYSFSWTWNGGFVLRDSINYVISSYGWKWKSGLTSDNNKFLFVDAHFNTSYCGVLTYQFDSSTGALTYKSTKQFTGGPTIRSVYANGFVVVGVDSAPNYLNSCSVNQTTGALSVEYSELGNLYLTKGAIPVDENRNLTECLIYSMELTNMKIYQVADNGLLTLMGTKTVTDTYGAVTADFDPFSKAIVTIGNIHIKSYRLLQLYNTGTPVDYNPTGYDLNLVTDKSYSPTGQDNDQRVHIINYYSDTPYAIVSIWTDSISDESRIHAIPLT